jgi:hypothetical protein
VHTIDPAVFRRLALVLAILGGFAGVHASMGVPSIPAAQASDVVGAARAPSHGTDLAGSGYGEFPCAGEDCQIEYCAAPTTSDHQGYAVPCEAPQAG